MNMKIRELINELTEDLINEYKISIPIVNIDEVVSRIGGYIETDNTLSVYSGGFIKKEGKVFRVYVSPYQMNTRRKFTIAHELGHLFLHMGFNIDEELWNSQDEKMYYRNGSSEEEQQANEFAAALLMPRSEYKKILNKYTDGNIVNTRKIAEYFNVSVNAASNRGKWLGYIQW